MTYVSGVLTYVCVGTDARQECIQHRYVVVLLNQDKPEDSLQQVWLADVSDKHVQVDRRCHHLLSRNLCQEKYCQPLYLIQVLLKIYPNILQNLSTYSTKYMQVFYKIYTSIPQNLSKYSLTSHVSISPIASLRKFPIYHRSIKKKENIPFKCAQTICRI